MYSIIAYVRTLTPIQNEVPKSSASFPMNIIMRTMPAPAEHHPIPESANTIEYGKYMVISAGCGDCHTQSDKGVPIPGKEFAGGVEFNLGKFISITSNITPDMETGIGKWTRDDFVKRFKACATDEYKNIKWKEGEFNTIMPWTLAGTMSESDLSSIYDYLRALPPVNNKVEKFRLPSKF